MKMFTHPMRKDGKVPVTLVFENGVQLRKIFTTEQVEFTKREIITRQEQRTAFENAKSLLGPKPGCH